MASLKSDIPAYVLGAFLGIAAGILEIELGDLLVTALFVLLSTLVLGFARPKRPWRWIIMVGTFVPLIRLIAYLVLTEKPYRAQVWESALGFLTGVAGSYAGAFARLGVDELFRSQRPFR